MVTEPKPKTTTRSRAGKAPRALRSAPKSSKQERFAVIETGGKQYIVSEGDVLKVEKLAAPAEASAGKKTAARSKAGKQGKDKKIVFDRVLLVDDGTATKVGTPYVEGAAVEAALEGEGKHKKVTVIKFKAKSRYFKKKGHRQPFSKVRITLV